MTETRLERTERETAIYNLPTLERILQGDVYITFHPSLIEKLCCLFPNLDVFHQSDRSAYPTAQSNPVDRITKLLNAHIITARQARACMRYRHCRDVFLLQFSPKVIDTTHERVDGGAMYDDGLYERTIIDCYHAILRHVPLQSLKWLEYVVAEDKTISDANKAIGGRKQLATDRFLQAVHELEFALMKIDA